MIYDPKTNLVEFESWIGRYSISCTIRADLLQSVSEVYGEDKNSGFMSFIRVSNTELPILLKDSYQSVRAIMEQINKKGNS